LARGWPATGVAVERGVGGDQAVEAAVEKHPGQIADVGFLEIRRDLEQQRDVFAVLGERVFPAPLERLQQARWPPAPCRSRRPGVFGDDRFTAMYPPPGRLSEAGEVIVRGVFVRGVLVFADVEADDAVTAGGADIFHAGVDARVVETHAVDDRLVRDQAEQARLRISGLRARGDRADFDEAEAEPAEGVDGVAFLVEPRGEADAVGKFQAHQLDGVRRTHRGGQARANSRPLRSARRRAAMLAWWAVSEPLQGGTVGGSVGR
jgi:hypothetical protein